MKKILLSLLAGSSVIIAGCGKSGQNMSFQEAYNVLRSQASIIASDTISNLSGSLQDTTKVDFSVASNQGFTANGLLQANGKYNLDTGGSDIQVSIDAKIYEPSFGGNLKLSAVTRFLNDTKNVFGYIDSFGLTPESSTGQVDGGIVTAMIGTLRNKWIQLNPGNEKVSIIPYRQSIKGFLDQTQIGRNTYTLFKEGSKTSIDGYTAYTIGWDTEGVSGFVHHILEHAKNIGENITFSGETLESVIQGIVTSLIQGYLIIYGSDNVVLRIDAIKTQDSGTIGLTYDKKGITWKLIDTDTTTILTGNLQKQDKELAFHMHIPNNSVVVDGSTENQQKVLKLNIITSDFTLHTTINGESTIIAPFTPMNVTGSMPLSQIMEGFAMLGGMGGSGTGN